MKKYGGLLILALVVIGAVVLGIRLISGAAALVSGAFNAVLGIVVIAALVLIVLWMFLYARKNR